MADLRTTFAGIRSPNPFWLASAPPTVNVSGPRYGAIHGADRRVIGFNNIELITDRALDVNLREIKQVKRDWPDRALVSLIESGELFRNIVASLERILYANVAALLLAVPIGLAIGLSRTTDRLFGGLLSVVRPIP